MRFYESFRYSFVFQLDSKIDWILYLVVNVVAQCLLHETLRRWNVARCKISRFPARLKRGCTNGCLISRVSVASSHLTGHAETHSSHRRFSSRPQTHTRLPMYRYLHTHFDSMHMWVSGGYDYANGDIRSIISLPLCVSWLRVRESVNRCGWKWQWETVYRQYYQRLLFDSGKRR